MKSCKTLFALLLLFLLSASSAIARPAILSRAQAPTQTATVNLAWTASPTAAVTYNMFRETTSGACSAASPTATSCTKLNQVPIQTTTYSDATAPLGSVFYYVVQAVNSSGLVSAFSNEATVNLVPPGTPGTLTCTVTITGSTVSGSCH